MTVYPQSHFSFISHYAIIMCILKVKNYSLAFSHRAHDITIDITEFNLDLKFGNFKKLKTL